MPVEEPDPQASTIPTFTATPTIPGSESPPSDSESSSASSNETSSSETSSNEAQGEFASETDAQPSPQAPTDTATPAPAARLLEAARLHRFGYYQDEQWTLLALLSDPGLSEGDRLRGRRLLAESYLAADSYSQALSLLEEIESETAAEVDDQRSALRFLRAEALVGLGRYEAAIPLYRSYLEANPSMEGSLEEIIGEAAEASGDHLQAALSYRRGSELAGSTSERARLLEEAAGSFQQIQRWSDAADAYEEILSFAVNPGYRVGVRSRAASAWEQAGEDEKAIVHWRAALDESPESSAAYLSLIELVDRDEPVDSYLRGRIDLAAEAYLPALEAFESYFQNASDDEQQGTALLGIARAQIGLGRWSDAEQSLSRIIDEYPACPCFGEAWIERARSAIFQGDASAGRRIYRTFAREHPQNPLAAEALWRSALSAIAEDNPLEAATDILNLVDAFPVHERAPSALRILALGSFLNGLNTQAVQSLTRLEEGYPGDDPGFSGYWLGRALAEQGNGEEARESWRGVVAREPESYYGVLSGLALERNDGFGQRIFDGVPAWASRSEPLGGDDGSQQFAETWLVGWANTVPGSMGALPDRVASDPDLINGRTLLDLNRRGEALSLLDQVYRRYRDDPAALYALALFFEDIGVFGLSVTSVVWLLDQSPADLLEETPLFLQRLAYPRHYTELVEAEARANAIDPLLFYSLIRQESIFEKGARSFAAAQGLAQIIPSTGLEISQRLSWSDYRNELLYRPYVNLRFGAFYLAWVRNFVDGNYTSALLGYNAGPGNAQRWRNQFGEDDALLTELIDFSEPRLYIRRILTHYYHYNRLY